MILQLAPDGRVKVVAGRPLNCPTPIGGYHSDLATHATLVMPQSITFGPSGDLYIAESDSQRINRVRVIGMGYFLHSYRVFLSLNYLSNHILIPFQEQMEKFHTMLEPSPNATA